MELLGKHIGEFVKLGSGKNFIFIRHGQSLANYSGVLAGFTDTRLTVKGREQAHQLFPQLYQYKNDFKQIHSSDLSRCFDTAMISLGFPDEKKIIQSQEIRELYFGKEENLHYDSLSDERKDLINSIDFKAKEGESWHEVRDRAINYMKKQEDGNHLIYSHGGLMCSLTWYIGLQDTLPPASAIGISTDSEGVPKEILFQWPFPEEEEI